MGCGHRQDRNRTSPFPYGGHRFEFRAVGSAQNVSLVNTVLNTISAQAFKRVADRLEGGDAPQKIAADLVRAHVPKVVFNGDNYDPANQKMLTDRGVWRIDSSVEAICRLSAPKNTALFDEMRSTSTAQVRSTRGSSARRWRLSAWAPLRQRRSPRSWRRQT